MMPLNHLLSGNRLLLGAICGIALLLSGAAASAPLTPQERSIAIQGGGALEYEILLPDDFDPAKTYPLALGGGYYWNGVESTRGWILVTLIIKTGNVQNRYGALLDQLKRDYSIEGGRAHMVCYSACGAAAFTVAGVLSGRFASVTTLTGHPRNHQELLAVKDMNIRLIVGETDTYWRQGSEKAHQDFLAVGADVTLEIIPNGGHVMVELVGDPFLSRLETLRP